MKCGQKRFEKKHDKISLFIHIVIFLVCAEENKTKNKTKRLFPQFPIFILKQKRKKERKNEGTQRRIVGKMAFVFYILQSISPLAEHLGSV